MIQIMKDIGLDRRDIRVIADPYFSDRVGKETTEETKILRVARQGCILSPL